MDSDEFRRHGHDVIDWIAEFLADPRAYPVMSRATPGQITASLPTTAPEQGDEFGAILADFEKAIVPGITHWNHPGFLAYFGVTGSAPGILAEALAAALNVNGMLWRTSPAATELEEVATDWLRQMLGIDAEFSGHIEDTASTSTLIALATAREVAGLDVREKGLAGRDLPRLTIYCSAEAHSSMERAAITLGIGRAGVRKIATDAEFRMRPELLRDAIEADLNAGARPLCVVATAGTTSTTSMDPLPEIAAITRRFGLWFHVDAAYAGAAAIVPELRTRFQGWSEADSIVVNPHKWLFVPIDCSVLYLRDAEVTRQAFTLVPDYLSTSEADSVTNLMDYGPALGRRFRALKLWMTLRYFGRAGIAERIREHIGLAHRFAEWVRDDPAWSVEAPVPFSTVCFRYTGATKAGDLDRINEGILVRVNASGAVFLSHTRLHGHFTLRVAVGNIRTEIGDLERAWDLLRKAAADI